GLAVSDEDFGQTLGAYGIGNGFYICWPILGPSLLRDSVGRVGDSFLDPLTYLTMADQQTGYSLHGGKLVNKVSLRLGDYEEFKNASFDPYVAVRNAYTQHRQSRVINEVSVGAVDYDASLDKIENIQLVESKDEVHVLPPSEKKEVVEAIPEVSWDTVGHGFYVLVGVFREPVNIDKQKSRLALIGKKAFVTRYNRGNYSFYGIEVSGGDDFASAKQIENELMEAGFSETTVIRH
ncbi:MAG: MlaA family lipoprotein, partial [Desulfobulbaceae bacterium]|nr:MlaA family lipoprotein [Desulfobulbaceae bacterium]